MGPRHGAMRKGGAQSFRQNTFSAQLALISAFVSISELASDLFSPFADALLALDTTRCRWVEAGCVLEELCERVCNATQQRHDLQRRAT